MTSNEILAPLEKLLDFTEAECLELRAEGFEPNELVGEVALFIDRIKRTARIRKTINSMTIDQQSALQAVAHALNLNSGPDYRVECQKALMRLSGLENYDYTDPNLVLSILKPRNLD